jgi:hypothetical protein
MSPGRRLKYISHCRSRAKAGDCAIYVRRLHLRCNNRKRRDEHSRQKRCSISPADPTRTGTWQWTSKIPGCRNIAH